MKNKIKTLIQQNPLLSETDLYEDDDPVTKRIPYQVLQPPPHFVHTLLSEIQCLHFNDSHISEDILANMTTTSPPKSDDFVHVDSPNANVIAQTPIKPTSTQSLPIFDPSFLQFVKILKTSFQFILF